MNTSQPTEKKGSKYTIILWGTGDTSKPRVRLLARALERLDINVVDLRVDIWSSVADKSQLTLGARGMFVARWLLSYPLLIWRYIHAPKHDAVLATYPGQFDVIILWPFARMRGAKIIFDMFLSWYDAAVIDRTIFSRRSPFAWVLYAMDWLACRAANSVFLDTAVHARFIEELLGLRSSSVGHVFVGVEPERFSISSDTQSQKNMHYADFQKSVTPQILFYGQFIPLHGIDTIIQAASLLEKDNYPAQFTIIGKGTTQKIMDGYIERLGLRSITRKMWVEYQDLRDEILRADVCLGIFGNSGKAGRVIPNKVFQMLALGKYVVTRKSPALDELAAPQTQVRFVPPGDPHALAEAIKQAPDTGQCAPFVFGPERIAPQLEKIILDACR